MAICAICERPITSTRDAGAVGSEVFHKACVRVVGTERSLLNRTQQRLMRAEAEALADRNSKNVRMMELENELREVRARAGKLEKQLAAQRDTITLNNLHIVNREAELRRVSSDLVRYEARLGELERERDAARSEAALFRTMGVQRTAPSHAPGAEQADDRDPAEVRFGLLELDEKK